MKTERNEKWGWLETGCREKQIVWIKKNNEGEKRVKRIYQKGKSGQKRPSTKRKKGVYDKDTKYKKENGREINKAQKGKKKRKRQKNKMKKKKRQNILKIRAGKGIKTKDWRKWSKRKRE